MKKRRKTKTDIMPEDDLAKYKYYKHHIKKGSHWIKMRNLVISKSSGCCQRCGRVQADNRSVKFHVHHLTYENFGNEREEELLYVCEPCHDKLHRQKDAPKVIDMPLYLVPENFIRSAKKQNIRISKKEEAKRTKEDVTRDESLEISRTMSTNSTLSNYKELQSKAKKLKRAK